MTPITYKIASIEIVVDKMHITGHTDKWCLENCDAREYPELSDVSYRVNTHLKLLVHVNKYTALMWNITQKCHTFLRRLILRSVSRLFHGYRGMPRSQEE